MTKKELRKMMEYKRSTIRHRDLKNKKIRENLYQHPVFQKASKVFVFYSVGTEVDTRKIIEDWIDKKKIYIPYIDEKNEMHAVRYASKDRLVEGKYHIPTVEHVKEIETNLDLILCPGLAFDRNGNRLGYGGGFYDRFMHGKKAYRIALAYEIQRILKVPSQNFDEKVDFILTEC